MRTFKEQLEVMMADLNQELKSCEKWNDGYEIVVKGKIELLTEVISQYNLELDLKHKITFANGSSISYRKDYLQDKLRALTDHINLFGPLIDRHDFKCGFDEGFKLARKDILQQIKESEYKYAEDYIRLLFKEELNEQ